METNERCVDITRGDKIGKKIKCPYCGKKMVNVCINCGAYIITNETYSLPLKKQPYMKQK